MLMAERGRLGGSLVMMGRAMGRELTAGNWQTVWLTRQSRRIGGLAEQ